MKQHRGNCIFCNEPNKLSRQHVWPDWLKKIFPHPEKSNTTFLRTFATPGKDNHLFVHSSVDERPGYILARKYRKVCVTCNNVWISQLEEKVKPNVEKLILGSKVILEADELISLAVWASIITIMAEFTLPEGRAISNRAISALFQDRQPLQFSRVYLGHYLGSEKLPVGYHHRHGLAMKKDSYDQGEAIPSSANYQTSIHILGELMILVDSTSEELQDTFEDKSLNTGLVQIYPLTHHSLTWPPLYPIGDAMLDTFEHKSSLRPI